jgi:hypothetical protein
MKTFKNISLCSQELKGLVEKAKGSSVVSPLLYNTIVQALEFISEPLEIP